MGKSVKSKIARALSGNNSLDKKALQMRKSWNEVDGLLKSMNKGNNKKK